MNRNLEEPKVTIGITSYNSEKTILRAINSALNQTWTNKSFLIWHKLYPEIIWGLEKYSKSAKEKIIARNPLNSFKTMLASRAYGRLQYQDYKKNILSSKNINIKNKVLIFLLLQFNSKIITNIYIYYILIFKKDHSNNFSPKLALFQLRERL